MVAVYEGGTLISPEGPGRRVLSPLPVRAEMQEVKLFHWPYYYPQQSRRTGPQEGVPILMGATLQDGATLVSRGVP